MVLVSNSDHADLHQHPPSRADALELPDAAPDEEMVIETDLTPAEGSLLPAAGETSPEVVVDDEPEHWEQNTDVVGPGSQPIAQLSGFGSQAGVSMRDTQSRVTNLTGAAFSDAETEEVFGAQATQQVELVDTHPPAKMVPQSVRDRLSERFELMELLGEGGMGQVYHARDLKLGEEIAVKMLRSHGTSNAEEVGRFKREIIAARRITHPNVIRIHDFGETEEETFISMELLRGGTLDELIEKEPVDITKATRIAAGIAEGLAAAHAQDIIHRDIKPQNILFTDAGVPKLVDFGIARLATQDSTQTLGGFRGTPYYMSPEQADGREVTQLSDVYSLGVVLFELYTGRRPFESDSLAKLALMHVKERPPRPRSIRAAVPRRLEAIIQKCLEKRPERRYESAQALARELRHVQARLASGRSAGAVPGQTRRIVSIVFAVGLLLAAAGLAFTQLPKIGPVSGDSVTPTTESSPVPRMTRVTGRTPVRTAAPTPVPTKKAVTRKLTAKSMVAPSGAPGGYVTFKPEPWAAVYINGVYMAEETPYRVRLKPGSYTITLVHINKKHTQKVTVKDGATVLIKPKLVK